MKRCVRPVVLLTLLALLPGCGKKEMDQRVDELILALRQADYGRFKAMALEALVKQVPEPSFQKFAQVVRRLGNLQKRSMKGIEAKTGGYLGGTYTLSFAQGDVSLEIGLLQGKLSLFNLTGDPIQKALKALEEAQYAEFKVARFEFQGDAQKPHSNIYRLGEAIPFTAIVYGVTYQGPAVHAKCHLKIVDGENRVVLDSPQFLDQVMKPERRERVVTIRGNLKLPAKGSFRVQLHITDVFGNQSLDYAQALVVE